MSTYLSLKNQVVYNIGNRTDKDTVIMGLFNVAQTLVAKANEWESLGTSSVLALTSGEYSFTIADYSITNLKQIRWMQIHDGTQFYEPLGFLSPKVYAKDILRYIHNTSGRPEQYSHFEGKLWMSKTLDTSYNLYLHYYKFPSAIVSESASVNIEECDGVLVALTTAFVWGSMEELKNANFWLGIASQLLKADNIEENRLIDFQEASKSYLNSESVSDYYKDPFQGRMP